MKENQVQKIMEILKREEVKMLNVVHTDAYSSVCVAVDLPFELSSSELAAYLTRVLVKQGYREIKHGKVEHLCAIYIPFGKPMFRYFTK